MLAAWHLLFLLVVLACPLLAQAQFTNRYEAGSYVLAADSLTSRVGQLRLKNQRKLLVMNAKGTRRRLTPAQISSFRIGTHRYAVVRDFLVQQGSRTVVVKAAFAERLASGQVTLFRYTHLWNSGAGWLYLYRYPISFYLVDNPTEPLLAIYNYFDYAKFQQQARAVLAQRPDLLRLLDEHRITYENFPAAIHSLNNQLPFDPAVPARQVD